MALTSSRHISACPDTFMAKWTDPISHSAESSGIPSLKSGDDLNSKQGTKSGLGWSKGMSECYDQVSKFWPCGAFVFVIL